MDTFSIIVIVFLIVYFLCAAIKKYSFKKTTKHYATLAILTLTKLFLLISMYLLIYYLILYFFPYPKYELLIKFVITPIILLFIMLKNNKKEVRKIKLKILNIINERKYKD